MTAAIKTTPVSGNIATRNSNDVGKRGQSLPTMETLTWNERTSPVAKKSDLAKRAENLLQDRLSTVAALGELLDRKAEQEAVLADTDAAIDKAVQACVEAGWSQKELKDLGVDRPAPRGRRAGAVLERRSAEPRNPEQAPPTPPADHSDPADTAAPPSP